MSQNLLRRQELPQGLPQEPVLQVQGLLPVLLQEPQALQVLRRQPLLLQLHMSFH